MLKAVYEHDDVLIDIVEREWGLRCHAIVTTENESVVRPDDFQTKHSWPSCVWQMKCDLPAVRV